LVYDEKTPTRGETLFTAFAALLGVSACRHEPTPTSPVQMVPPTPEAPPASSLATATATSTPTRTATPPPAPAAVVKLAMLARRDVPSPTPAGKAPPPRAQRCCCTNPSCGARSCSGLDTMPVQPHLLADATVGIASKPGLEEEEKKAVDSAHGRIEYGLEMCAQRAATQGVLKDSIKMSFTLRAAGGGAPAKLDVAMGSSLHPSFTSCLAMVTERVFEGDGQPIALTFPVAIHLRWDPPPYP
jgi:hypothetical protein